jgi:alpha-ketoglutarate-dependent taurine dioxygenase
MKLTALKPFGLLLETSAAPSRAQLLALLKEHKLLVVRGAPAMSRQKLLEIAGEDLIQWSFGPVMEMKADPETENYLFSREPVPFHWDGAFHEEPAALLFNCIEAPLAGSGGATLFSNTELLLKKLSRSRIARYRQVRLTYTTEKKAHYGGTFSTPLLSAHPLTGASILRYAEPVESKLNPVKLAVEGADPGALAQEMRELLYSQNFCYAHEWQDNDLLLADNFSLVHGRRAFSQSSPRHLRRIQLRNA